VFNTEMNWSTNEIYCRIVCPLPCIQANSATEQITLLIGRISRHIHYNDGLSAAGSSSISV